MSNRFEHEKENLYKTPKCQIESVLEGDYRKIEVHRKIF